MSSDSESCTWTEESVVRIKRLPTNALGGKVRNWPSVSKGNMKMTPSHMVHMSQSSNKNKKNVITLTVMGAVTKNKFTIIKHGQ